MRGQLQHRVQRVGGSRTRRRDRRIETGAGGARASRRNDARMHRIRQRVDLRRSARVRWPGNAAPGASPVVRFARFATVAAASDDAAAVRAGRSQLCSRLQKLRQPIGAGDSRRLIDDIACPGRNSIARARHCHQNDPSVRCSAGPGMTAARHHKDNRTRQRAAIARSHAEGPIAVCGQRTREQLHRRRSGTGRPRRIELYAGPNHRCAPSHDPAGEGRTAVRHWRHQDRYRPSSAARQAHCQQG